MKRYRIDYEKREEFEGGGNSMKCGRKKKKKKLPLEPRTRKATEALVMCSSSDAQRSALFNMLKAPPNHSEFRVFTPALITLFICTTLNQAIFHFSFVKCAPDNENINYGIDNNHHIPWSHLNPYQANLSTHLTSPDTSVQQLIEKAVALNESKSVLDEKVDRRLTTNPSYLKIALVGAINDTSYQVTEDPNSKTFVLYQKPTSTPTPKLHIINKPLKNQRIINTHEYVRLNGIILPRAQPAERQYHHRHLGVSRYGEIPVGSPLIINNPDEKVLKSNKRQKKSWWLSNDAFLKFNNHGYNKNIFESKPEQQDVKIIDHSHQVGKNNLNKLFNYYQQIASLKKVPVDGATSSSTTITNRNNGHHFLPNGPPPFRPTKLMLNLQSKEALDKIKQTELFKKLYKSRVYYLYLDILQQLSLMVTKMARNKLDKDQTKMALVQIVMNKLAHKGGQAMKLKWPLVMLNPQFLRELISTPTFLIMLFHAVEVAYMSMQPQMSHVLRPLVRLIEQPGPEKEEKIWWRRKRIYDTLNGIGASELQPNLKTKHFKRPGKQASIAFPTIVALVRKVTKKAPPNPHSFQQFPTASNTVNHYVNHQRPMIFFPHIPMGEDGHFYPYGASQQIETAISPSLHPRIKTFVDSQQLQQQPLSMATTLVENDSPDWNQLDMARMHNLASLYPNQGASGFQDSHIPVQDYLGAASNSGQEDWLSQMPNSDQLLSQSEFNSLDPRDREHVLQEARDRFEEFKWTNDLIKQHSDFIESITSPKHQSTAQSMDSPTQLMMNGAHDVSENTQASMEMNAHLWDQHRRRDQVQSVKSHRTSEE